MLDQQRSDQVIDSESLRSSLRDNLYRELVAVFKNVTEKIEVERALVASEERLRNTQAYANLGYWELHKGGSASLCSGFRR